MIPILDIFLSGTRFMDKGWYKRLRNIGTGLFLFFGVEISVQSSLPKKAGNVEGFGSTIKLN
jgi:hypothetical protein